MSAVWRGHRHNLSQRFHQGIEAGAQPTLRPRLIPGEAAGPRVGMQYSPDHIPAHYKTPSLSLRPEQTLWESRGYTRRPTGCRRGSSLGMPSPPTSTVRFGLNASTKAAIPGKNSHDRRLLTSIAVSGFVIGSASAPCWLAQQRLRQERNSRLASPMSANAPGSVMARSGNVRLCGQVPDTPTGFPCRCGWPSDRRVGSTLHPAGRIPWAAADSCAIPPGNRQSRG